MFKKDMQQIGDVYGDVLNSLKHNIIKEDKQPENAFNSDFPKQDGGPSEKGGYSKALHDNCGGDCDVCKCGDSNREEDSEETTTGFNNKALESIVSKLENPDLTAEQRESLEKKKKEIELMLQSEEGEENIKEESIKSGKEILNNIMTKKTLSFDKLYKSVLNENFGMGNEDAENDIKGLGLDDEMSDDEIGDEVDSEGDVTITLDRATAEKLLDIIGAAMGETESESEGEAEGDELDFGGEDEGPEFGEEDEETLGKGSSLTGKKNTVGKVKPKGGSASSDVTDEVGDDGDYGHAILNAKQPNMGTGSNNKVGNYKQGAEYIR
jgi:hypothetical protein